jgi:hypothetical protein
LGCAEQRRHASFFEAKLLSVLSSLEARAAIYRAIAGGLEGYLCLTAALCAGGDKVLSLCAACVLLCVAARLAALRLVHKALLFVEGLLACREYELFAAFLANQGLVLKDFGCANHVHFFVHLLLPRLWFMVFALNRISTDTFENFNALD